MIAFYLVDNLPPQIAACRFYDRPMRVVEISWADTFLRGRINEARTYPLAAAYKTFEVLFHELRHDNEKRDDNGRKREDIVVSYGDVLMRALALSDENYRRELEVVGFYSEYDEFVDRLARAQLGWTEDRHAARLIEKMRAHAEAPLAPGLENSGPDHDVKTFGAFRGVRASGKLFTPIGWLPALLIERDFYRHCLWVLCAVLCAAGWRCYYRVKIGRLKKNRSVAGEDNSGYVPESAGEESGTYSRSRQHSHEIILKARRGAPDKPDDNEED